MHIEEEARKCWCPFATEVSAGGEIYDTRGQSKGFTACIASACMAWRKAGQIGIGPNGEKRDRDMDGRTRWVDTGFCGLAGDPR